MTLEAALWRDYTPELRDAPGIFAGRRVLGDDAVAEARALFERGVRRVELCGTVDLARPGDGRTAVRALAAVRELTSWGIVVAWRLRVPAGWTEWRSLGHLAPPAGITGVPNGADLAADLRRGFYLGRCLYREGPGFIEVRDRRADVLSRIVIDDPAYRDAVHVLERGAPFDAVPADVLADLEGERLVARVGEHACWLPYRVHRWPHPPLSV